LYTTVPERTFHRIIDSQSPEDTVRLSAPKRLFWGRYRG
jgi:hypothetical protein